MTTRIFDFLMAVILSWMHINGCMEIADREERGGDVGFPLILYVTFAGVALFQVIGCYGIAVVIWVLLCVAKRDYEKYRLAQRSSIIVQFDKKSNLPVYIKCPYMWLVVSNFACKAPAGIVPCRTSAKTPR
jgi:hypothetical protein